MKYKVTLFSVATISATVFVDAISEEDAKEIATTSCNVDDFEIDEMNPTFQLGHVLSDMDSCR